MSDSFEDNVFPAAPGSVLGKVPVENVSGAMLTPMEMDLLNKQEDIKSEEFSTDLRKQLDEANKSNTLDKTATPVHPATEPVVPPDAIDIKDLPEEKQIELLKALKQTQEATADSFVKKEEPLEDFETVSADQASTTDKKEEHEVTAQCPKCKHNFDQPVVDVSSADKYAFIAATLGGQRFFKEYRVFNGNILAVFRELTPNESDLALKQLDYEVKSKEIVGRYDYLRRLTDYRLAMSLERFQLKDKEAVKVEEVENMENNSDDPTILPSLLRWLNGSVFVTDHVRRVVGIKFMDFQRKMELMEARAEDDDFFTKTEEQTC